MNRSPIGIFDSGIGGLTVVKAVRHILPNEDIIYLGDTARLPYGTKSTDAIIQFSIENTQFLIDRGVKYIVIACYSSASVALDIVKKKFTVPVIGVIKPGVRKAIQLTRTGSRADVDYSLVCRDSGGSCAICAPVHLLSRRFPARRIIVTLSSR